MKKITILSLLLFVGAAQSAQQSIKTQESGHGFIDKEMVRLALIELKKPAILREQPLQKFKAQNPECGILLNGGLADYSLSVRDLLVAGAVIMVRRRYPIFDEGLQTLEFENALDPEEDDGEDEIDSVDKHYEGPYETVDLSQLSLTSLDGIQDIFDVGALRVLHCEYNRLNTFPLEILFGLPHLKEVYLSYNPLTRRTIKVLCDIKKPTFFGLGDWSSK